MRPGDTIEYLADVSSPPNQKGIRGQTKVIDRDIPLWTANFLLRGGMIRPFDPASPLQLEEEETEKGPDESAEVPGPDSETKTKGKSAAADKKERSTSNNGQGKTIEGSGKAGDHGPAKSDPKGKARNRRD